MKRYETGTCRGGYAPKLMTSPIRLPARRRCLATLAGAAAALGVPSIALAALPAMTEGPFYPPATWRARELDWDADLTRVMRAAGANAPRAAGEWLDLGGSVVDERGRTVDAAEIEIWQCDAYGSYRHPRGAGSRVDAAFQGFGSTRSDAQGRYRFRTIRPVPYPGRTPHIHVRLRHPSFGELTSQLFVAGDPGNERDFLWRRLGERERDALAMRLSPAADAAGGLRWQVRHALVVPA